MIGTRTAGVWAACMVMLVAAGCGGKSNRTDEPGAGGSAATTGGTGTTGGMAATGGSANGGSANGGSANGGASVGGSAGRAGGAGETSGGAPALPEACLQPSLPGECEAAIPSFFHDAETGVCKPFIYGGCGGNDNRFPSLESCQEACHGGTPNYDACEDASDCVVSNIGCCGVCDGAGLHELTAYAARYAELVNPSCEVACGPCPPALQETLKYFVPACIEHECRVVDIRESEATKCEVHDDCRLRSGAGCCEDCSGGSWVAVNRSAALEALVCGRDVGCDACAPPEPPVNTAATCEMGHCAVTSPAE